MEDLLEPLGEEPEKPKSPIPEQRGEPSEEPPTIGEQKTTPKQEKLGPMSYRQFEGLIRRNDGMSQEEATRHTLGRMDSVIPHDAEDLDTEGEIRDFTSSNKMQRAQQAMVHFLPRQMDLERHNMPADRRAKEDKKNAKGMSEMQRMYTHAHIEAEHGHEFGGGVKDRNAYPNYDEPDKE